MINTSIKLACGQQINNRLLKAAMSEQMADRFFNPTAEMVTLYRRWAEQGVGLILTGNIMLSESQRGEPRNVVLNEASDLAAFRALTASVEGTSAKIWAQINHPGKQIPAFLSSQPLAPSAVALEGPLAPAFKTPRAMTEEDIRYAIAQFTTTARLAKEVGFDGVQLHGAHGYLVSQFLSPRHNQRKDQWGGSFENRLRFAQTLIRSVRAAVGNEFPIGIKLNSSDYEQDGYSEADALQVMKVLEQEGVDLIEVSGGTYEVQAMMEGAENGANGFFVNFAKNAAAELKVPIAVTGGFTSSNAINKALSMGIDMVGMARVMVFDTAFADKVLAGEEVSVELPRFSTGSYRLDQFLMVALTWYELQMSRIGAGKNPNHGLSVWAAAFYTLKKMGLNAFKPRRFRAK